MTQARREILAGLRAGLLVLGFFAMLAQAFAFAAAGPIHLAGGPDGAIICSVDGGADAGGNTPATPHNSQNCVCAALCHFSGVLPVVAAPAWATLNYASFTRAPGADYRVHSLYARVLPPARGPPRARFVQSS